MGRPNIIPSPALVGESVGGLLARGLVWDPLFSTLRRTFGGFLIGFVAGIIYGFLAGRSYWFRRATDWLFNVVFYTPSLIIIFVGLIAFGRSDFVVMVIIGFAIVTDVGTYIRDSISDFDVSLLRMADSFKVGSLSRASSMLLPYSVPVMLAAGRIGFSLAWKLAFLAGVFGMPNGLGWELRASYRVYNMPDMLGWLTVFIVAQLLIEQVTRLAESAAVRWR